MLGLVKLTTIAAALALPANTMGWAITLYSSNPCNDAPGSNWHYWIYEGSGQSPCVNVGTAPPAGVSCRHYLNGGATSEDCGGGFVAGQAASFYIRRGDCSLSRQGSGCYAGRAVMNTRRAQSPELHEAGYVNSLFDFMIQVLFLWSRV
ncbi:hypothetical protein V495_00303 [Pseudogymnoascus sp. VKM F-4514 (FW-929)]|nr:hypothetical protein V495_00303 [Pseudogymnoascus sp. VKM F-4514 (FW-929)]KFY66905.1 hypothetical protein V497_00631 [Pseudogymnoascus sp. VKM F-4516 (FW-969)]